MNRHPITRTRPAALHAAALVAAAVLTWAVPGVRAQQPATPMAAVDGSLPQTQHAGEVSFITGGVGQSEAHAMKQAMSRYPLAIEIVERQDTNEVYTAGADVRIRKHGGETLLQTRAQGPFVLADVPAGAYDVEVTLNGQTQTHRAQVPHAGHAKAVFVFRTAG